MKNYLKVSLLVVLIAITLAALNVRVSFVSEHVRTGAYHVYE